MLLSSLLILLKKLLVKKENGYEDVVGYLFGLFCGDWWNWDEWDCGGFEDIWVLGLGIGYGGKC